VVFARDDACAVQKTCSPRLAPNQWRPRQRAPASAFAASTAQPTHRFADRAVDGLVVEALQKAVQCREVGHAHKP